MIKTITLNKTLQFDDTLAPTVANELGYPDKIVDTTKLDINGNVPLEPSVDAKGNAIYDMTDEVQTDGTVKQVQGKQRTQPVDVYIANPDTPLMYLEKEISKLIDSMVAEKLAGALIKAKKAKQEQAITVEKEATVQSIKASITTVTV